LRYFTPELIERLGSPDETIASQADAEWNLRQEAYERKLLELEARMPPPMREFSRLLLHDARVHGIARQEGQLIMVLQKDIPPRHLVILTYDLAGEPTVDTEALPPAARSPVMAFEYDELDAEEHGGRLLYRQSILFSNGWELQLAFTDVRFVLAEPLVAGPGLPALPRSA
jgi:hypothetical protein